MTKRFFFPPIDMLRIPVHTELLNNLVAYYDMDGAAGDDEADAHGNAETAAQTGSPASVTGRVGTARHTVHNGVDQYLTIPAGNVFSSINTSFSIVGWIKMILYPGSAGSYHTVFEQATATGGFSIKVATNFSLAFGVYGASGILGLTHVALKEVDEGWSFFALSHNAGIRSVLVYGNPDGLLEETDSDTYSGTFAPAAGTTPVEIGTLDGIDTPSEAYMDAISVFSKALSFNEIRWLYNSGFGRAYAEFTTPVSITPVEDWWDVAAGACISAYLAKGAASLAASYEDLTTESDDITPGSAPSWLAERGWIFDGSQYLVPDLGSPDEEWSVFIRYANATIVVQDSEYLAGCTDGSETCGIMFNNGFGSHRHYNIGSSGNIGGTPTEGILGFAGKSTYINTVFDAADIPAGTDTISEDFYIGCLNNNGTPAQYFDGDIIAIAIYNEVLTDAQAIQLMENMNTL